MRKARLRRRAIAWLRLALALLSMVVALGGALPAYARMAAGAQAHVCHCDTGGDHAHCACPICFPELDTSLEVRILSISGKCGDDDTGWRTFGEPGVMPAPFVALVALTDEETPFAPPRELVTRSCDPPDPPPPRSVSL
ncbi:MAG: hypothetical protein KIT84_22495 [Labilithrix sp.]|nr:hypothetical protein [Labilithrix sp.]MCW5813814.1 hypothetical protein [Labilithrix sp.]